MSPARKRERMYCGVHCKGSYYPDSSASCARYAPPIFNEHVDKISNTKLTTRQDEERRVFEANYARGNAEDSPLSFILTNLPIDSIHSFLILKPLYSP